MLLKNSIQKNPRAYRVASCRSSQRLSQSKLFEDCFFLHFPELRFIPLTVSRKARFPSPNHQLTAILSIMPLDASSMDDDVSIISAISSIFDGDSSAEIDQLRNHRRVLYSDAMRLQIEYRRFLDMSMDEQEDNCFEFDAFKAEWVLSLRRYIDSARTMYGANTISMPHYRAVAKSVDRLVTAWNTTPYITKDVAARPSLPSVDDILETTAHGFTVTPKHSTRTATHSDMQRKYSGSTTTTTTVVSTPEPPSGPPSGPNIAAWLEDAERSSISGAKLPRASSVEAEAEAETTTETPGMITRTDNESLRHPSPIRMAMFDLFDGLKKEMERLSQENEQLKQQIINAAASAAARADVEKEKERDLKEAAIQRAEEAERERDEIIDGFIRTCSQHSANHRQATGSPLANLHCSTKINLRKKNLQIWLASFQVKTNQES